MTAGMFAAGVACYAFLFDALMPSVNDADARCRWFESFHDEQNPRELVARVFPATQAPADLRREWARRLGLALRIEGPADHLTAQACAQV